MQGSAITYTYKGEVHPISTVGLGDLVAFEDYFDLPASVLEPETELNADGEPVLVGVFKLKWIAFLIYRAARRNGVIAQDVVFGQDFIDEIDDFDIAGAEVASEVDPSQEAAPQS